MGPKLVTDNVSDPRDIAAYLDWVEMNDAKSLAATLEGLKPAIERERAAIKRGSDKD